MTTHELLSKIIFRLGRLKVVILLGGLLFGTLLYMYALSKPVFFTVTSTVFPLTAGAEKGSASSRISELLGGGNSGAKSITEEANVSIEEVGRSKKTREAVVKQRLAKYGNKPVAEILIHEFNRQRAFGVPAVRVPKTDEEILYLGSEMLKNNYSVKFNKNSLLEVKFTSTDPTLLAPVSYILIERIAEFYKELKIKKAKADFDFAEGKVDSLQRVLARFDRRRIAIDNHTLFTPPGKLQYNIPVENLENDKLRVLAQKAGTANNREDAAWRLQKETPIIEILDKPEPPYSVTETSKMIYGLAGFFLGLFLFAFATIAGLLYQYVNQKMKEFVGAKYPDVNTTTTA